MPYPRAASQRRENVGVEFPDSHEPYFGSGSFSRPEAGLTNLERWPIFFSGSVACSGSTEIIGQFLEAVSALLHNHLPRLAFEFSLTTSVFTYFTHSCSQIVTYLWKHQVNLILPFATFLCPTILKIQLRLIERNVLYTDI